MNALTEKQIHHIDRFLERKGVHFIDVRYELTDHFAEAILLKTEELPHLSFETALRTVYQEFGRQGMIVIMDQKEAALKKYWKGRIMEHMLDFIKLPQILIMVLLSIIIAVLIHNYTYGFTAIYVLVMISYWYSVWKIKQDDDLGGILNDKHILPVKVFRQMVDVGTLSNAFFYTFLFLGQVSDPYTIGFYPSIIIGVIIATFLIYLMGSIFVFPYWLKAELKEKYPFIDSNIKIAAI